MGYTHYWRFHRDKMESTEALRQAFKGASDNIRFIFEKMIPTSSRILRGGLGEGEPIINETEVWFNGDASTDCDHETFSINWKDQEAFGFCKTARKPYDSFVKIALLCFYDFFPSHIFVLSSDGDASEWQEAVDIYNEHIATNIPNPFSSEEVFDHMTK